MFHVYLATGLAMTATLEIFHNVITGYTPSENSKTAVNHSLFPEDGIALLNTKYNINILMSEV